MKRASTDATRFGSIHDGDDSHRAYSPFRPAPASPFERTRVRVGGPIACPRCELAFASGSALGDHYIRAHMPR